MINMESWFFFLRRKQRVAGHVEFLHRLEHGFCSQCSPGVVAGEQGLEFADNLLGCCFRDQIAFSLETS